MGKHASNIVLGQFYKNFKNFLSIDLIRKNYITMQLFCQIKSVKNRKDVVILLRRPAKE